MDGGKGEPSWGADTAGGSKETFEWWGEDGRSQGERAQIPEIADLKSKI